MEKEQRPRAPGLKWRQRQRSDDAPYWFADPKAVASGYTPRSVNLSHLLVEGATLEQQRASLVAACDQLQATMLVAMSAPPQQEFDGTFASMLRSYQTDPHSSFHEVKPSTRDLYARYIKKLTEQIGTLRVDRTDGRDVKEWFQTWREAGERDALPKARMVLAVLKAAVTFGVIARFKGCAEFAVVMSALRFEAPRGRSFAPTAAQVIAARAAAHAAGFPSRALVYALQFETTLRQGDIIGEWVYFDDARPSAVLARKRKWFGLSWSHIDADLIINRFVPSKTSRTSGAEVSFDLKVCPMVMEELAFIPAERRTGPLVVREDTGMPWQDKEFGHGWRTDFKAAELPAGMWNRDFRAGGVTAGRRAGASKDDIRKLAGHADERTTDGYDRDTIEAHRRVMAFRKNSP